MSENKILIPANQDDILEMAEKIKQNKQESAMFEETFAKYKAGMLKTSDILQLGETPYVLQIAGAKNLPLTITQRTIRNAQNSYDVKIGGHSSGHEIDDPIVRRLPELIRTPIFVIEDEKQNLRVIIDMKDNQDYYIMCFIALNKVQGRYDVNEVTTILGKRDVEEYIIRAFENNAVKAMDKEKAESLFQTRTVQYDKVETTISFDYSIAFSTANVKYPKEKSLTKTTTDFVDNDENDPNNPKKPNGGASGGGKGGDIKGSQDGNVTNTYSGKENKTMGNLEIYRSDNRSLQQLLDDYEAQEKAVKEKALDEITNEDDYERLSAGDKQLLDNYNANKGLLVEAKMALDFVATSTIFTPNGNEPCVQMLMDSKTDYAHAVATLTGGFDKRMGTILETVDNSKSFDRSYANVPLTDKTISGIIKDEMKGGVLETATVGDLAEVISVTRGIRDTLRIKDDKIVDDTNEVLIHDKGRLNAFVFIDSDEQERENIKFVEAVESEVVESNDGYALNTSKQTAGNEKAIGEKVNAKNEVVHNEAPRATTTDTSKVGGNVKLEEAKDKGTEDDKKPSKKERGEER